MDSNRSRAGSLTLFSFDGSEIYAEFAEATWRREQDGDVRNHVFTCVATEGAFDTIRRVDMQGIEHVKYQFEGEGEVWNGDGRLLASEHADAPARAIVKIEALDEPARA